MQEQPLVSFVVIAYQQQRYVREAILSAFAQTYQPLEIVLSDDCSPDRTFVIMQEEAARYHGPHRIVLNRNETNLGLAGNLNRVFELARGQFFVVQAGDDISVPQRTEELVRRWWRSDPAVDLVCSYFAEIDEDGNPTGFVEKKVVFVPDTTQDVLRWACAATGACAAYDRRLFDKYGPLDRRVISEDWVYPFRAWLCSGIALVEQPLVLHRTHKGSLTVRHRQVKTESNATVRGALRREVVENRLAVATEWLRACQVGGSKVPCEDIERKLQRLVRLWELQLRPYDTGRLGALATAVSIATHGGGLRNAAKVIVRHVAGLQ